MTIPGKGPVVVPPGQVRGPKPDRFLVVGDVALNFVRVSYVTGLSTVGGDLIVWMDNGSQLTFSGVDAETIRAYLLKNGSKPTDEV